MTNCHVAMVFSQSESDGGWSFLPGLEVILDCVEGPDGQRESGGPAKSMRIDDVIGIHPALDLALLRVTPPDAVDATAQTPRVVNPRKENSSAPEIASGTEPARMMNGSRKLSNWAASTR